eukprot:CAMPEP_0114336632 /NCGR_PEP_ID=MMETSP0101-20121206/5842_1 /TAXON_ID=38822 ORGANISM="Pteridomonas danica, Strain PT" /NCGR_SAMPLE_ID=MMETSP0101 /ASSEMBLY_ACC=CAM_ASM_000211 /LENGTH=143 /DNA_ID=CAMNT_0001468631 /DNA_START=21 /DNA_END=452 /DNA_ORIENTATION=-
MVTSNFASADEPTVLTIQILANGEAKIVYNQNTAENKEYCLTAVNGKQIKVNNIKHDIDKLLNTTDTANKVSFSLTKKKIIESKYNLKSKTALKPQKEIKSRPEIVEKIPQSPEEIAQTIADFEKAEKAKKEWVETWKECNNT